MSKKRDTFIFKKSWTDALKKRPASVQLEVYNAITLYAIDGVIPQMSEIAEVVFDFIRIEIDENNAKYEEVVKKRREAGKRGMEKRYGKESEEMLVVEHFKESKIDENSNKSNKEQQILTNVTKGNKTNKSYQNVTNVTDSDNDSVSDFNKKETISKEIVKKEDELLSPPLVFDIKDLDLIKEDNIPVKSERVDYERIVNLYHEICVSGKFGYSLPKILNLNDERKNKIRSRFKEMGCSYERIEEVFREIMASDFLVGKNNRGWVANIDWIFANKSNWVKVLEGKYKNNEPVKKDSQFESNMAYLKQTGVRKENIVF